MEASEELLWREESVSILASLMLALSGDGGDMERGFAVWASPRGLRVQQKGSLRPSIRDRFIAWEEITAVEEGGGSVIATI